MTLSGTSGKEIEILNFPPSEKEEKDDEEQEEEEWDGGMMEGGMGEGNARGNDERESGDVCSDGLLSCFGRGSSLALQLDSKRASTHRHQTPFFFQVEVFLYSTMT